MASSEKSSGQRALKLSGISTNNLKNISISLPHQSLVGITGISGGGKSSLAYDTIYSICRQEFESIEKGYYSEATYSVESADGLIPAVAVRQNNENTNPRSTIYTFLNISSYLNRPESSQSLNQFWELIKTSKPINQCTRCEGLGRVQSLDCWSLIDQDKTILQNPFVAWRKSSNNKLHALLLSFCQSKGIRGDLPFSDLDERSKKLLLTCNTEEKLEFSFKVGQKRKRRKEPYIGYANYLREIERSLSKSSKAFVDKLAIASVCPECNGSRLNMQRYLGITVGGFGFDDILLESVDVLLDRCKKEGHVYSLGSLSTIFKAISALGIGYLNLSRSIPSLSGGELQKLRLAKLTASGLQNICVVLDEVSCGMHPSEYEKMKNLFTSISRNNNLVILIEHNGYFLKDCDEVFELGPGSGSDGGRLTPYSRKKIVRESWGTSITDFDVFSNICRNNVREVEISVPIGCMTAVVGVSGSGKSSIGSFLDEEYRCVSYVSQKQVKANVRSSVATYLELGRPIAEFFQGYFNVKYDYFFPSSGNPCVCGECDGAGVIRFNRSFDEDVEVLCPKCEGLLFDELVSEYRLANLSICDVYSSSIEQIPDFFDAVKKLAKAKEVLSRLGVGYLSLNRKVKSLSGGELKRLKLAKALLSPNPRKVLIVDEPSAGLDATSLTKMIHYLDDKKGKFRSIMIIEHRVEVVAACDYLIEVGPGAGKDGGGVVFSGDPDNYVQRYKEYSDLE